MAPQTCSTGCGKRAILKVRQRNIFFKQKVKQNELEIQIHKTVVLHTGALVY